MIEFHFDAGTTYLVGVDDYLRSHLKQHLTWKDNSVSYLIVQKGQSWLDPYRDCYNITNDSFGTGLIPRVVDQLDQQDYEYSFHSKYDYLEPADTPIPDWAFEHQRKIVANNLHHYRSIVESPTGSGKSYAAAFLLSKFPTARCLVIVPSTNLMYNMSRTIEKVLDEEVGLIGDGKSKWRRVTIGIVNSLSKHHDGKFAKELADQQILVIDEVHRGASDSYVNVGNACINTAYRLGLSATASRSDGADLVMESVVGPKTLVIPTSVMVDLNIIHAPDAYFLEVKHDDLKYKGAVLRRERNGAVSPAYNTPNGKPEPEDVYTMSLVRNQRRNELAVAVAQYFLYSKGRGGNLLFLIKSLEHGHLLQETAVKHGLDIPFIDGFVKGKKRMEVLDAFRSGKLSCLIASSILNEGEDLPMLEMTINLAGGANETINTQRNGRNLRIDHSGTKRRAIIVDFYDVEKHYLASQSRKRMQIINSAHPGHAKVVEVEELFKIIDKG